MKPCLSGLFFEYMATIYKAITVLFNQSKSFGKKVDLRIEKGKLLEMGDNLPIQKSDTLVEGKDLAILPALVDLRVHNTLPGNEHRETWTSLQNAAIAGGIHYVQLLPTGQFPTQTVESVEYIKGINKDSFPRFIPMAPLTVDNKGENFADLMDLESAGVKGFSHKDSTLQNADLFLKCLQYLMTKDVVIYSQPNNENLSMFGQINEGLQSTLTGLKGIPTISEVLSIKRDLDLLEYVIKHSFGNLNPNFGLHFYCISSKESVELIKEAKFKGLPVTCSVSSQHLLFDENAVSDFDSNFKIQPPLRTLEDKMALKAGVLDGTIDAIVSDHHPIEVELKEIEFDLASFGVIGIQTLMQSAFEGFNSKEIKTVSLALSSNPKKLLGIKDDDLEIGKSIVGSIVDLKSSVEFKESTNLSLSKNSPYFGFNFKTQIIQVFN